MALAGAFLALATSAWGVADVIQSTNNNRFTKDVYSSDEGDLVRFQHTGGGPHDVTSTQFSGGERLFKSATITSGSTAVNGTQSLAPGTYPFFCTVHPSTMRAELVVRASGSPPPDGGSTPPASGLPSNDFSFTFKKNKKKGTAMAKVEVPGPGDVELAKNKKVKGKVGQAEDAGTVKVPIEPKRKAKKKLNQSGKTKVKAEFTYTPNGGEPNTKSKKLGLRKKG